MQLVRFASVLFAVLVAGAASASAQSSKPAPNPLLSIAGKSYALVVGIDAYTNGWPRLRTAVSDATAVADTLRGQGFDVRLETNLSAEKLRLAIDEFFLTAGGDPEARLLFWFAGHGDTTEQVYTKKLSGYIVGADAANPYNLPDPQKPAAEIDLLRRSVAIEDITARMRRANARHILLVFDSCFSGTAFSGTRSAGIPAAVEAFAANPARQLITSGTKGQLVSDNGRFRTLFVNALLGRTPEADANRDGYLTASELGGFLTDRVINATQSKQTPVYGALRDEFDIGDFIFILPWKAEQLARGPEAKALEEAGGPSEESRRFWEFIRKQANYDLVQRFLDEFPSTPFRSVALDEMKVLKAAKAQPDASPGSGTSPPARNLPWNEVQVLFGTNRKVGRIQEQQGRAITQFTAERGELQLGSALVSLPKTHAVGQIERPTAFSGFNLVQADPAKHVTTLSASVETADQFANRAGEAQRQSASKSALVFVHGYNTTFESGLMRAAQIAFDMRLDGPVYLFSWPSAGSLSSYNADREAAQASQPDLMRFLELIAQRTGAGKLHVISHAQGGALVLNVLSSAGRSAGSALQGKFGQVVFAAPDVDASQFNAACTSVKQLASGVTVYASSNDSALTVASRIVGDRLRAGQIGPSGPAIALDCASVIDVSALSAERLNLGHSYYAEQAGLLSDVNRLLQTGGAPDARSANLQRVETTSGTYWRYRN